MKGAIASVEIFGFRGDDPVKRFTFTVWSPLSVPNTSQIDDFA